MAAWAVPAAFLEEAAAFPAEVAAFLAAEALAVRVAAAEAVPAAAAEAGRAAAGPWGDHPADRKLHPEGQVFSLIGSWKTPAKRPYTIRETTTLLSN